MTKQVYEALVDKYSQYSDRDLASEYVKYDYRVNELWENVDDKTADTREILLALIGERYVKQYIGVAWDETRDNWAVKFVLESAAV